MKKVGVLWVLYISLNLSAQEKVIYLDEVDEIQVEQIISAVLFESSKSGLKKLSKPVLEAQILISFTDSFDQLTDIEKRDFLIELLQLELDLASL